MKEKLSQEIRDYLAYTIINWQICRINFINSSNYWIVILHICILWFIAYKHIT